MTGFDDFAKRYANIDLFTVRIVINISQHPCCSIKQLAKIMQTPAKQLQAKIRILSKKTAARPALINNDFKGSDRRCRCLKLTLYGQRLAGDMNFMLVEKAN